MNIQDYRTLSKVRYNVPWYFRFDLFGIYVVMFLGILKTLLQVLLVFSILIIAFGLSFYILLSGGVSVFLINQCISMVTFNIFIQWHICILLQILLCSDIFYYKLLLLILVVIIVFWHIDRKSSSSRRPL